VPSFVNGDLVSILLESHPFNSDLIPSSAVVGLDEGYRLNSIGICPGVECLSRETAQVVDAGYNSDVSWGRWVNGTARFTSVSTLQALDLELGPNNGIHYLIGVPTASMPVSGSAYYALGGATSPTFSSGTVAPGTFSGEALVNFGSGLSTRVGLQGSVIFGSGEHYRLSSNGVQDGAGRLVEVGNSQLQMTGRTTFGGNIDVTSHGQADRLECAGGACQAIVRGGFYGPNAARMGVGYAVGRVGAGNGAASGGDTIHGVAVLNRQ
jgi:hypothetical protein